MSAGKIEITENRNYNYTLIKKCDLTNFFYCYFFSNVFRDTFQ